MGKLSAKWVPKWLNADEKRQRCQSSEQILNFFFGAIQMISCRDWWPWTKPGYITMIQRQSNNQLSGGITIHPAPKFRVQKSPGKFLTSIFWDDDSILLIDYLTKGQTINAEYYSSLLMQLKDILKEIFRGKFTKVFLFLHDNAPAHWGLVTQKKLAYLDFQCLDHPPYSPDLFPSDYNLFPGLKQQLKGGKSSEFFLNCLQKLEQRARKCIKLHGIMLNKSRVWSL